MKALRTFFKFVHPVLPITAGLLPIVAEMVRGHGGPCGSPLILALPILILGVLIGLVLSGVRISKYIREEIAASETSATKRKPE
jgi:hypothetical protein